MILKLKVEIPRSVSHWILISVEQHQWQYIQETVWDGNALGQTLKSDLFWESSDSLPAVSPFMFASTGEWCLPQGSDCLRWSIGNSKGLAILFTKEWDICAPELCRGLAEASSRDCVAIQLLSLLNPASSPSTYCHSHPAHQVPPSTGLENLPVTSSIQKWSASDNVRP